MFFHRWKTACLHVKKDGLAGCFPNSLQYWHLNRHCLLGLQHEVKRKVSVVHQRRIELDEQKQRNGVALCNDFNGNLFASWQCMRCQDVASTWSPFCFDVILTSISMDDLFVRSYAVLYRLEHRYRRAAANVSVGVIECTAIHLPPMKRLQKNCCGLRCWCLGIWVEWESGYRASRSPLFRKFSFVVG